MRRRERPGSVQRVSSSLQTAQMRTGDFPLPGDSRNRWGRVQLLQYNAGEAAQPQGRKVAAFVETPAQTEPQQFAIELRAGYAVDSLSAFMPDAVAGQEYLLTVRIQRGIDIQKGHVVDTYLLGPINSGGNVVSLLPVSCVLSQQLGVYVEISRVATSTPLPLYVQVIVSIVNAGCGCHGGYANATITRFPQLGASTLFLRASARRRQFVVQNFGSSPLYLGFSESVTTPGGSQPAWTVALEPQEVYESNGLYSGPVSGAWDADGAGTDYAMVTDGG